MRRVGWGFQKDSSSWLRAGRCLRGLEVRFLYRAMLKLFGGLEEGEKEGVRRCVRGVNMNGIDVLANPDVPDLAFIYELFESLPGWVDVFGEVVVDLAGVFLECDWPA